MFIDTQIISNVKKGRIQESIRDASISSVVASELLMIYSDKRTSAEYYVPLTNPWRAMIHLSKMDHAFSKNSTDKIVFNFGSDYESLIEFGSIAVSKMINERSATLLRCAITHLNPKLQRLIRDDFDFIVSNNIRCYPITRSAIGIGHVLLTDFQASGESIKSTFRNTWNDLLILATAWDLHEPLRTKDSQLNRLAASRYADFCEVQGGLAISVSCEESPLISKKESKGYINNSWRVRIQGNRRQAW